MQYSGATILSTLRLLRIFYAILVLSVIVCGFIFRLIPSHANQLPNFLILTTAGALTVAFLGLGLLARLVYLQPALETLRTNPNDIEALVRWRLVSILSAVLAECAMLLGVAIHSFGGPNTQASIFMVAGVAAMLLWWPREP